MSEDAKSILNSHVLPALVKLDAKADEQMTLVRHLTSSVQGSNSSLDSISTNTQTMAKTLGEMHLDNRALIGAVSGKKHVPVSIFMIVVSVLALIILIKAVETSGMFMKLDRDSLELSPNQPQKKPGTRS